MKTTRKNDWCNGPELERVQGIKAGLVIAVAQELGRGQFLYHTHHQPRRKQEVRTELYSFLLPVNHFVK